MITVTLTNVEYAEGITFADSEDGLIAVTVKGHAIPGDSNSDVSPVLTPGLKKGENLICAAVSFAALNLLRSTAIMAGIRPVYETENGFMSMSLSLRGLDEGQINTLAVLLESFLIGMLDLQKENPGFIEIQKVLDKT